jgi:outer membrane protein assembly factor BamD (BamD/ComL family)
MKHVFVLATLLFGPAGFPAAAQENAARAEVGKPVQQAQALVREKRFTEALAQIKKADAVPKKSAYETYIVEETRAAAELGAGDYAAAVTAVEGVLGTHILPPADAQKRLLTLVQIEYQLKDYAKTIAAAERYYKEGGADPEPRRIEAQSYYLEGDYAGAATTIRAALDDDARAGKPPDEQLLLALADSAFKTHDAPGFIDAKERLVASHPKHQYWADLIRAVGQSEGFAARLRLDLDRVAVAAGAFDRPEQYMTAAELALQAGYPGDAKNFLDKGLAVGVRGTRAEASRAQRLAALAKSQSDEDAKSLAQQAREAEAKPDGRALEKLGEAYASYGRFPQAEAALEKGLATGGLDHPDDAKLHLGMVYAKAGDPRAKPVLQGISGRDGTGDLARLWLLAAGAR